MTVSPHHHEMARRAAELLADGDWHDYEDTLAELMKLVPPGVALRTIEADRRAKRRARYRRDGEPLHNTPPRQDPVEERIQHGARYLARGLLKNGSVFQIDRPGVPGSHWSAREANAGRRVRMIALPRTVVLDALPLRPLRPPPPPPPPPPRTPNPVAVRVIELLGDGQWHSYQDTLAALMKVVPNEIALQRYDTLQARARRQREQRGARPHPGYYLQVDEAQRIHVGARAVAGAYLRQRRNFELAAPLRAGRPTNGGTPQETDIRMIKTPRLIPDARKHTP